MSHLKIDGYGNKCWYNDEGQWHREDGPAREWTDGIKSWWINGKRHRENGPAVEWDDGAKLWWYNDKLIGTSWDGFTQEDFERYLKIKEYW